MNMRPTFFDLSRGEEKSGAAAAKQAEEAKAAEEGGGGLGDGGIKGEDGKLSPASRPPGHRQLECVSRIDPGNIKICVIEAIVAIGQRCRCRRGNSSDRLGEGICQCSKVHRPIGVVNDTETNCAGSDSVEGECRQETVRTPAGPACGDVRAGRIGRVVYETIAAVRQRWER